MLPHNVAEGGRHRGESFDRFLGNVGDQLVLEVQRRRRGLDEEPLDQRAGGVTRSVGNLVNSVNEFAFGIGAVNGGGYV
jgi:hypothetical protein